MNYIVVDFEFTNSSGMRFIPRGFISEIIEIGMIVCDEQKELSSFTKFVKPVLFPKLSQSVMDFTGISQSDADNGMTFSAMLAEIDKHYVSGETKIVAWGDSDELVLKEQCRRYKLDYPFSDSDYLDLAKLYSGKCNSERTISLLDAVAAENVGSSGYAHMALDDARNTALILQKLLQQNKIEGSPSLA
jgi:sporulation inhibitor KapD